MEPHRKVIEATQEPAELHRSHIEARQESSEPYRSSPTGAVRKFHRSQSGALHELPRNIIYSHHIKSLVKNSFRIGI